MDLESRLAEQDRRAEERHQALMEDMRKSHQALMAEIRSDRIAFAQVVKELCQVISNLGDRINGKRPDPTNPSFYK